MGEQTLKNLAEPIVAYLIAPPDARRWRDRTHRHGDGRHEPGPTSRASAREPGEFSDKRRLTAIILCLLVGLFGGHRFYLGRTATAYVQLFTLGGFALWALADLYLIVTGELTDGKGRALKLWV